MLVYYLLNNILTYQDCDHDKLGLHLPLATSPTANYVWIWLRMTLVDFAACLKENFPIAQTEFKIYMKACEVTSGKIIF